MWLPAAVLTLRATPTITDATLAMPNMPTIAVVNGDVLTTECDILVLKYAQGFFGADRAVAQVLDITERKESEQKLRDSQEVFQGILATTLDGFWITDTKGKLLSVNDAYARQSGYSREELLKMGISDLEVKETNRFGEIHGCACFKSDLDIIIVT